jgi:hemoglobin
MKHFNVWLGLWRDHCRAHIGGGEAEELIAAAEMIGERIRFVIERHAAIADDAAAG